MSREQAIERIGVLYEIERENIGISDSTGFTQQAGDQRSRGFEIDFAAEPAPRLRTFLSFAYNDSELTSFVIDGKKVANLPYEDLNELLENAAK